MNESTPPEKPDRLMASLGLGAGRSFDNGCCPSDEQLAAFISNKLKGAARQAMLQHLDACSECRHHWAEVASFLETETVVSIRERSLSKIWRYFNFVLNWKLATSFATAALGIFLVVLWQSSQTLDARLDSSYAAITAQDEFAPNLEDLPLPWDSVEMGFSEPHPRLPAQAFRAGLWWGNEMVSGTKPVVFPDYLVPPVTSTWLETEWVDYYEFGRWTVLLWVLAKFDQIEIEGSKQHQRILEDLLTKFTQHSGVDENDDQAIAALKRLQSLLKQDQKRPGFAIRLRRGLETVMQQLAG